MIASLPGRHLRYAGLGMVQMNPSMTMKADCCYLNVGSGPGYHVPGRGQKYGYFDVDDIAIAGGQFGIQLGDTWGVMLGGFAQGQPVYRNGVQIGVIPTVQSYGPSIPMGGTFYWSSTAGSGDMGPQTISVGDSPVMSFTLFEATPVQGETASSSSASGQTAFTPRFLGPPVLSTESVSTPSSVTPDSLAPATQGRQTSPSPTVTPTPATVTDSDTTEGTSGTVLLAAAALAAYFFLEG